VAGASRSTFDSRLDIEVVQDDPVRCVEQNLAAALAATDRLQFVKPKRVADSIHFDFGCLDQFPEHCAFPLQCANTVEPVEPRRTWRTNPVEPEERTS
jgi:hypothetical protein